MNWDNFKVDVTESRYIIDALEFQLPYNYNRLARIANVVWITSSVLTLDYIAIDPFSDPKSCTFKSIGSLGNLRFGFDKTISNEILFESKERDFNDMVLEMIKNVLTRTVDDFPLVKNERPENGMTQKKVDKNFEEFKETAIKAITSKMEEEE